MKGKNINTEKELSINQKRNLELMENLVGESRPDIKEKILKGEPLDLDELLDFSCEEGDGF